MQSDADTYRADGLALEGRLFLPAGPRSYPGVLVFPEAFGIGPLALARSGARLKAIVGFHTSLATRLPAAAGVVHGSVLVCIGSDDPFITAADRAGFEAEMRAAGADWQMQVYGNTVHSFTNPDADRQHRPDAIRYGATADRQSWRAMLSLFDQTLS